MCVHRTPFMHGTSVLPIYRQSVPRRSTSCRQGDCGTYPSPGRQELRLPVDRVHCGRKEGCTAVRPFVFNSSNSSSSSSSLWNSELGFGSRAHRGFGPSKLLRVVDHGNGGVLTTHVRLTDRDTALYSRLASWHVDVESIQLIQSRRRHLACKKVTGRCESRDCIR